MSEDIVEKALEYLRSTKDTSYKIAKSTSISQTAIGRYKKGAKPTPANAQMIIQYFEGGLLTSKSNAKAVDIEEFMLVPLVPISARAGYTVGYGDEEYVGSLPTVPVIVDKNYKGKYRTFEVEGDSMDDGTRAAICDKDKVLGREVKQHLWQYKLHINDWFFIIVHREEGIVIKQIIDHNTETGDIICHSLNPLFEDFKLNLNDVVELYNVIKIVDRNTRI